MKAPSFLEKRCQKCGEKYPVPNIRECRTRAMILQTFPCPNCEPVHLARCVESTCRIPFRVRRHHAKGRCLRCYNRHLRYERRIA
jgi:hypothetical protein